MELSLQYHRLIDWVTEMDEGHGSLNPIAGKHTLYKILETENEDLRACPQKHFKTALLQHQEMPLCNIDVLEL